MELKEELACIHNKLKGNLLKTRIENLRSELVEEKISKGNPEQTTQCISKD